MKTLILKTNTAVYQVIDNGDETINVINRNGQQIDNIGLFIKNFGGFADVLKRCKTYDGTFPDYLKEQEIVKLKNAEAARKAEEKFLNSLSDFWKDVHKRIGMDVCTPFMNKFRGHSFVAYSVDNGNGFVWSKTMKTVFLLHKDGSSFHYWPKTYKKVIRFGSDEIENL